jgi:hypothetical protein
MTKFFATHVVEHEWLTMEWSKECVEQTLCYLDQGLPVLFDRHSPVFFQWKIQVDMYELVTGPADDRLRHQPRVSHCVYHLERPFDIQVEKSTGNAWSIYSV